MRIWDVEPCCLCRQHPLGEHAELHANWSILTEGKEGYSNHPETGRWQGKLKALYLRHERLVKEMEMRGYGHRSLLDEGLATGEEKQGELLDSIAEQIELLRQKGCACDPR